MTNSQYRVGGRVVLNKQTPIAAGLIFVICRRGFGYRRRNASRFVVFGTAWSKFCDDWVFGLNVSELIG